ncbi:hypothetical protein BVG19_g1536 [[Candida] boidinii]|nr:hypothetical protein BVG19_g1536 [[Candida] boidinii]OWB50284.1 hypothetical protein B5S27_g1832 [[Candida] boidinii]OWB81825.1 hypothetical protein B5S33_g444 [[Candida] boidinii]
MESTQKPRVLLKINAQFIAIAHTICASSAFLAALFIGYSLHYYKIVKNEHYGYPDEWFPSVSATIGDRYPERSVFQILIALTAGPRFLLLFFSYIRLYKSNSILPKLCLISGIVRTFTCGGWVYITSTDDHDFHDIFMILYIVLTIPWTASVVKLTPPRTSLKKFRTFTACSFFAMLVPLVYLFIQHKVHRVKGAYSYYAYCEWSLIILDIGFDALSIIDFKDLSIELTPSTADDDFFFTDFNVTLIQTKHKSSTENASDLHSISYSKSNKLKSNKNSINNTYVDIAVNFLNSFIFWSVYSSLFLCVWYFPLWYMGISGYEAIIVATFSPFLLFIPGLRSICIKFPQAPRILTCAFGIGAYLIADPELRLMAVGAGIFFGCISVSTEIYALGQLNNPYVTKSYATTFTMGLILSSIAKFAFWTNNPIWPIMNKETGGWNGTGLTVGLIAAALTKIPSSSATTASSASNQKLKPKSKTQASSSGLLYASLGFGSLLFSLLSMLTDTSTMILWCWDGYPINGPIPVPHGAVSLFFLCAGIYSGFKYPTAIDKVTTLGVIGAILLYSFHGWVGYIGSLLYGFWLVFITPPLTILISKQSKISLAFGLSFIVDCTLCLAHVWVVAYAFVPGGPILRERTDIVLGTSVLLILFGVYGYKKEKNILAFSKKESFGTSPSDDKIEDEEEDLLNDESSTISKIFNYLFIFTILSSSIAFYRFPFEKPQPNHPESRLITAGIWTIHFGLDNDMWASEHRMRDLIKELELDVIGLLESDTERIIMGNRDLTQRIAEELNMYADFGPGPNKHTWGAALLSKFPIVNSTHHLLPSPVGELAPAIHATLDCYGEYVDVVVFHSGQEEDEEDRRLQSLGIAEIMGSSDRPMILLSYLVTVPKEGNYNTYVSEKSQMHDIDETDWDRWCEYILYKKLKRTGYARISRGSITDTEVQVGKFVVPENSGFESEEFYSMKRIDEQDVDESLRFPSMFYGDGVRDHRFHVFDEPRYFD